MISSQPRRVVLKPGVERSQLTLSVDYVIEAIRGYARARGWSEAQLADRAGIRADALIGFYAAEWHPNAKTLRKLWALLPEEVYP